MYILYSCHIIARFLSVRDGCGRGRNEFAGRVQNHHVRFSSHRARDLDGHIITPCARRVSRAIRKIRMVTFARFSCQCGM